MSYFYRSRIGAVVFGLLFQIDQNLVQKYRTSFLVAVRSTFADNCDDACLFQLFDVSGECTVGDIEMRCQFIHVHAVVFQQNFNDFDTDFGSKGLVKRKPLFQRLNVKHIQQPPVNWVNMY